MKGLTKQQFRILEYIQEFIKKNNYSPSYREIMTHFGFTSPASVYKHIKTLIGKNVLKADRQSHRSMMPVVSLRQTDQSNEVKLPFIGNLSIGYPLELFKQPQLIAVPSRFVSSAENTYVLQVQGDALQDEWIKDGDMILIEAKQEIQPGEIILGLINQHDTVLKRFYPEGQHIRLESQHPYLPSLTVRTDHISIQGILVALLRGY